jgi:hypothetical protein
MLRTLKIAIPDDAATKLNEIAQREFRQPKDQAGLLLVEAIEAASRRVRRERDPVAR